MRFILDVWPDVPGADKDMPTDNECRGLLAWALSSIESNPDLEWELRHDSGRLIRYVKNRDARVRLDVAVENHYDDDVVKSRESVVVPCPPLDESGGLDEDELEEWAYDNLFTLTGTGRHHGDAGYFVTIVESPDRMALKGREFEWGT